MAAINFEESICQILEEKTRNVDAVIRIGNPS